MTFSLAIDATEFQAHLTRQFEAAAPAVQNAMADELYRVIAGNFGAFGIERPYDWAALSKPYAKKVKRDFATLEVSGALKSAVIREYSGDTARVYTNNDQVPYAMAQMKGYSPNNLPARSVFPFAEDGSALPFTQASVVEAARQRLSELI